MGMAINLKHVVLFIPVFFIYSCKKNVENKVIVENKKTQNILTDTTYINGILLELINNNGEGELKVNSKNYKIEGKIVVGAPNTFLRYNKKVVSHKYPDVNIDDIILFKGKRGIQPIIFKKDSIIYTDHYITIEDFEYAPDEIMYYQFAHQRNKK